MNDQLEERLGSTLERQAGGVAEGPRFSADDILRAGRTAARRRTTRIRMSAAATAGLTVLAIVAAPTVTDAVRQRVHPVPAVSKAPAPPRSLPTDCPVERLPVPAHSVMDMVIDMDPTGRYIVGRTNPGAGVGRLDMLIWDNGHLQVVHVPGDQQLPTDINADGVAVGVSGAVGERAWIYRDGAVTYLPGNRPTIANAINDAGVVVGSNGLPRRPAVWRSPSAQPAVLPMPSDAWEGEARDIDVDGTIVGTLTRQRTGLPQAYVWLPNGKVRALPLPVIDGARAVRSQATAIADGWVAGTAWSPHGDVRTRWNLRTGEVETFPGISFGGHSVSADGWLVGNRDGRAVLAGHQGTLTLPDLDNHDDVMANTAVTTSRDGQLIAGDASPGRGLPVPVVWRCG